MIIFESISKKIPISVFLFCICFIFQINGQRSLINNSSKLPLSWVLLTELLLSSFNIKESNILDILNSLDFNEGH